jgi:hypothetical protein
MMQKCGEIRPAGQVISEVTLLDVFLDAGNRAHRGSEPCPGSTNSQAIALGPFPAEDF